MRLARERSIQRIEIPDGVWQFTPRHFVAALVVVIYWNLGCAQFSKPHQPSTTGNPTARRDVSDRQPRDPFFAESKGSVPSTNAHAAKSDDSIFREPPARSASQPVNPALRSLPAPDDRGNPPAHVPAGDRAPVSAAGGEPAGGRPAVTASVEPRRAALTEIRQRLERIGGRNLRVSPHPEQAGKWQARCEVPYPQEPARVRVFDAEAGTDELQLLTAVVEAAEKWVAEQKR